MRQSDARVVGGNEEEENPDGTAGNLNLPIGGTEEPEFMNWKHRADFVPTANGKYIHYNKQNSAFWNTLWICFIPPKYDPDSTKRQNKESNACLITKVNGNEVYNGEIKTGTRSARNTSEQHPEQDLFLHGIAGSDYKIRIHGHWGSTVEFRNVSIRPRINE